MSKMKGGELIAEYLIKQKVPYVFGICGHGNVGILDPLHAVRDKLKLISPRHEQCAGHMADGYFRVRHQPVATLTSTGPGSANLVMSLATALSDSSAFLAITSNVPTSQMNRGPFQEIFGPVMSLLPYDTLDEAIARVNATPYGLATGLFTNRIDDALRAARRLEVGGVHINETSSSRVDVMPYGGSKDSGFGREGPRYAVHEMTEERIVTFTLG